MNDWFTTKEFAKAQSIPIATAKDNLAILVAQGVLEKRQRREIRTWKGSKWEQRPITNYYRYKQ